MQGKKTMEEMSIAMKGSQNDKIKGKDVGCSSITTRSKKMTI